MPFVILPSGETRYYNGGGDEVIHYTGSDAFGAGGNTSQDHLMGQDSTPLAWSGTGPLPWGAALTGKVINANPGWTRPTAASPNGGPPPTVNTNNAMALAYAQQNPANVGGHFNSNMNILNMANQQGYNGPAIAALAPDVQAFKTSPDRYAPTNMLSMEEKARRALLSRLAG